MTTLATLIKILQVYVSNTSKVWVIMSVSSGPLNFLSGQRDDLHDRFNKFLTSHILQS